MARPFFNVILERSQYLHVALALLNEGQVGAAD